MRLKPKKYKCCLACFIILCSCFQRADAQFTVSGQLRMRAEYRDGQGAPLPKEAAAAFFISQRTRLNFSYTTYRLKFGLSLQDARVWGQDASTINRNTVQDNNGLMLHEAWAELGITDSTDQKHNLSLKIGRQEIVFDDQRLIGNLDWLQQARRHDAAILKYAANNWNLQLGAAFNQNKENSSGTVYNPVPPGNYTANTNGASAYKSFEFGHANRKWEKGNISFLFFSDQFSKYVSDSSAKKWETGSWTRFTTGFYFTYRLNKTALTASSYYQGGKTFSGQNLSAGLLSAFISYNLSNKISAGPGIDFTSGGSNGGTSHAFDPLYGTPHKFWGLMDYFYAASPFGGKGLVDYYLKSKFSFSEKFQVTGDVHQFFSASKVEDNNQYLNRNFGTEADVVGNYYLTKIIGFELGYSHFFSTATLTSPSVKNIPNANHNSNWAYLMISIRPTFFNK